MKSNNIILIGYSGHAFVAYDILLSTGNKAYAYCDSFEKQKNPFGLKYLGPENTKNALEELLQNNFFIALGDNRIRHKIYEDLAAQHMFPDNAIHQSAIVSSSAIVMDNGIMISAGVTINALATIGNGAICNTNCIIEHECEIGSFAHIGPGAILCGNVKIGENTFVGAGAVIKQGMNIGKNVIIGAGAIVVKDVPDNVTIMGNPAK